MICALHRFSAKNTNILTLAGKRQALLSETIWPAQLNARSDGTDVAGINKYLGTSFARKETLSNCSSTIVIMYRHFCNLVQLMLLNDIE